MKKEPHPDPKPAERSVTERLRDQLKRVLADLTPREREIIKKRLGADYPTHLEPAPKDEDK